MASYCLSFVLLLVSPLSATRVVEASFPLAWKIMPAATLVFVVGLADDLLTIRPRTKILGQITAAMIACSVGLELSSVGGIIISHWISFPLTVIWLVACSNAFNLIDGVDGLAAGAGLFATITIILGALLNNNYGLALATVPLAGALLGFLRYNFNPASIFLGDSGSLTMGFLLGCFAIIWGQTSVTLLGLTAPLLAMSVPLLDTMIAIARRFLSHKPIFGADRGHVHHRLLARGLSPKNVALALYAACGAAAALSLLASVTQDQFKGLIIVIFVTSAWLGVRQLRYAEFGVASKMLMGGSFRHDLNSRLTLHAFDNRMTDATGIQDCWEIVKDTAGEFGFTFVELRLPAFNFAEHSGDAPGELAWQIAVPLPEGGELHLSRPIADPTAPTVLPMFVEALHRHLSGLEARAPSVLHGGSV